MKTIRVRFHKNSKFLESDLPRDHIFYAFKNEDQPYQNDTILIVEDCIDWKKQHIAVNNHTGVSSGQNFVVDPVELAAL